MASANEGKQRITQIRHSTADIYNALRSKYGLEKNEYFGRDIRHAFQTGVHQEVSRQAIRYLETKFRTQDRIADYLCTTRSNVSKMKQNLSIPVKSLEIVSSNGFVLPTSESVRNGLIEAAYFVRRRILKDTSNYDRMTTEQYYQLVYGEVNEWYDPFVLAIWETEDYLTGK